MATDGQKTLLLDKIAADAPKYINGTGSYRHAIRGVSRDRLGMDQLKLFPRPCLIVLAGAESPHPIVPVSSHVLRRFVPVLIEGYLGDTLSPQNVPYQKQLEWLEDDLHRFLLGDATWNQGGYAFMVDFVSVESWAGPGIPGLAALYQYEIRRYRDNP